MDMKRLKKKLGKYEKIAEELESNVGDLDRNFEVPLSIKRDGYND